MIEYIKENVDIIDEKVIPIINSFGTITPDHFPDFAEAYHGLAVVFEQFKFKTLAHYCSNYAKLCDYCSKLDNTKAHQKTVMLIKDSTKTLNTFHMIFSDKNALMAIRRDCEVQLTKVDRLFRGEFFSLHQSAKTA
ncbi:MAG: hypothetical protein GY909_09400 [Oligoflexia bacterium]|nr:hypothetical protein [Oligoflexia bacterium]